MVGCAATVDPLDGGDADTADPPDDPVPSEAARTYAETWCSVQASCACVRPAFTGEEECAAEVQAGFEDLIDRFGDAGFSSACFDQAVARFAEEDACQTGPEWLLDADDPCVLWAGDGEIGDDCLQAVAVEFEADTCRPDLQCYAGTCREDPLTSGSEVGVGFGCIPSQPPYCGGETFCDPSTNTCAAQLDPGDACPAFDACTRGYFCRGIGESASGVCEPRIPLGEACPPEDPRACAPLEVDAGTAVLTWGIACEDGTCAAPQPLVCERPWWL